MDGENIDPYFLPPPTPSLASAKVSCQEAASWNKRNIFDDVQSFIPFVRYCLMSKGVFSKNHENYSSLFPEEIQKEEIQ